MKPIEIRRTIWKAEPRLAALKPAIKSDSWPRRIIAAALLVWDAAAETAEELETPTLQLPALEKRKLALEAFETLYQLAGVNIPYTPAFVEKKIVRAAASAVFRFLAPSVSMANRFRPERLPPTF